MQVSGIAPKIRYNPEYSKPKVRHAQYTHVP